MTKHSPIIPRHPWRTAAKAVAWSIAGVALLAIVLLVGATLYLTPQRLTKIVNEQGSRYLLADVRASNVDWKFWSTFPCLEISADSLTITSRTLTPLPRAIADSIPVNSPLLLSAGNIRTGINLLKALTGNVSVSRLDIGKFRLNLVSIDDSVCNFLIVPPSVRKQTIPHIDIKDVTLGQPMEISYFNLQEKTDFRAEITGLKLEALPEADHYKTFVQANLKGTATGYPLPQPLSLTAEGEAAFRFDPLAFSLSGYRLSTGPDDTPARLSTLLDLDFTLEKTPSINSLRLTASIPDAGRLIKAIPEGILPPEMEKIEARLPLNLSASLIAPYLIKKEKQLPAFSLAVTAADGEISYPLTDRQMLCLSGLGLDADLLIDPRDPEGSRLRIADLSMTTDGTDLHLSGEASALLSAHPVLKALLNCDADLEKASARLLPGSKMKLEGDLKGHTAIECRLGSLSKKQLEDIDIKGDFKSALLKIDDAASGIAASLSGLDMKLGANAPRLNLRELSKGNIDLDLAIKNGKFTDRSSGVSSRLADASVSCLLGAAGSMSNPTAAGKIRFKAGEASAAGGATKFSAEGVDTRIDATLRHIPYSPTTYSSTAPTSKADSIVSADTRHTPLNLVAAIPPMIQTVLSLADVKADVKAREGRLTTDAYPCSNRFSDLNLHTNLDTLIINSLNVATNGASAKVEGEVAGMRAFLTSASPVPLEIDLDTRFDDVDINRLAGNYYRGVALLTGRPADLDVPPMGPFTAADSLCVAIPRNIKANVRLHSDKAEYMQWSFAPLSTTITLADGNAALNDLRIGSGFCTADLDWTYGTADLDSIFMHLDADIADFSLEDFMKEFPSVTRSAPQLENLSGTLSLHADGDLLMFPDMFLNAPSMRGEATLDASGIEFERDKEITRYTRLMLIKGDGPLRLDSLNVHAAFHDNLLQVDPFTLRSSGYSILAGGVNNLQGEIYYHFGLLDSPFHIPFGINLTGNFRHPGIRFGGRYIHDGRERKIASDLADNVDVNIMSELRHGWLLFVTNAAKYDAANNQDYVFNVR